LLFNDKSVNSYHASHHFAAERCKDPGIKKIYFYYFKKFFFPLIIITCDISGGGACDVGTELDVCGYDDVVLCLSVVSDGCEYGTVY